jgi:hypothetical protein
VYLKNGFSHGFRLKMSISGLIKRYPSQNLRISDFFFEKYRFILNIHQIGPKFLIE